RPDPRIPVAKTSLTGGTAIPCCTRNRPHERHHVVAASSQLRISPGSICRSTGPSSTTCSRAERHAPWDVVRAAAQPRLVLLDDLSAFAKGDCINPGYRTDKKSQLVTSASPSRSRQRAHRGPRPASLPAAAKLTC